MTPPAGSRVSRCPVWYEVNLHALSFGEMRRATGSAAQACLGFVMFRLFGVPVSGPSILLPERITLIEPVSADGLPTPRELGELGFTLVQAFHLPEFSGDNVSCCFLDRRGTTSCDVIFAQHAGRTQSEAIFYSHFGGQPLRSMKSVARWEAEPLERPPEKPARCCDGDLQTRYQAHLQWLASQPDAPLRLTWESIVALSSQSHADLVDFYLERGLYQPAAPAAVRELLREKGLTWEPRPSERES